MIALCVATMQAFTGESLPGYIGTFGSNAYVCSNTPTDNLGVVHSYQWLYERCKADILAYVHDDVECYEPGWDKRVLEEFNDPKVGIVGFGGAVGHGHPDLYKTPYELPQLSRYGYRSNVRDAEVHGERFAGSCNVAFLDGFMLAIRRSFLDRIHGWSSLIGHCDLIGYDMAICAMARRYGYKIRMVGVDSMHFGGRTSVNIGVKQQDYNDAHAWFYEEFRDVMPCEVQP